MSPLPSRPGGVVLPRFLPPSIGGLVLECLKCNQGIWGYSGFVFVALSMATCARIIEAAEAPMTASLLRALA